MERKCVIVTLSIAVFRGPVLVVVTLVSPTYEQTDTLTTLLR